MPVQPATVEVEEPTQFMSEYRRVVTPKDAEDLQANAGKWFEIKTRIKSDGSAERAVPILRINLRKWYGGRWSVTRNGLKMFVRYDGNEAAAA